jgi:hypothetical protein
MALEASLLTGVVVPGDLVVLFALTPHAHAMIVQ